MILTNVYIEGFRSVEKLKLTNCGNFNVLIGKNNTGKSNILSAIQGFFSHINGKSIITSPSNVGRRIDFYGKNKSPINITLTFLLSLGERDVLIQDIIKDAPQMRNALQGIDASLQMSVTLTIVSLSSSLGFVSKITISSLNGTNEKDLLKVSTASAEELNNQIVRLRSSQQTIDTLQKLNRTLDSDDWRMIMQNEGRLETRANLPFRTSRSLRSILSRNQLPVEIIDKLISRITSTTGDVTYEEFINYAQKLARDLKEENSTAHEEPLKNKLDTFAGEDASVPSYILNILQKISEIKILYLREQRKQIGKDEAARLLSLKTRRKGPEVLRNIQETVSALLGVKIDAFESDTANSEGKTIAELDVDDFLVEVNGSGIRESLRLILDVEFEQPHILLVEEPETHLHPALETSMMQYLKSASIDRQVFITTHSTNFLDTTEMKNVYLISKQTSTQAQLLNFEEAETQVPRELGIRLSSLFMFDTLVFVEGPSDASIIRTWASKIGVNLNQANVGFIMMGGSRNIAHYASEDTLSFLKKRQVQLWFLIDRDERNDLEIAKIKKNLEKKANICILEKREIENYLIVPRAIAKFIKVKQDFAFYDKKNDNLECSVTEIQKTLEECAENLKQLTIDKRVTRLLCKPMHMSFSWELEDGQSSPILEKIAHESKRIVGGLEEIERNMQRVYEEQVRQVDRIWDTQKFNLVPGDDLLDIVCKKYNVRFKKLKDGPLLAAQMNIYEIDEEVQRIIREIGSSNT